MDEEKRKYMRDYMRAYRKRNPETHKMHNENYRMKKKIQEERQKKFALRNAIDYDDIIDDFVDNNMVATPGAIAPLASVLVQLNNKIFVEKVLNKKTNFPMSEWRRQKRKEQIRKISEYLGKPKYNLTHYVKGWKGYELWSTREIPKRITHKKPQWKELEELLYEKGKSREYVKKFLKKHKQKYKEAKTSK